MKRLLVLVLVLVLVGVAASLVWRWRKLMFEEVKPVEFKRGLCRMEVVNGCGVPRLARAVMYELQERGYDVYEVGNTSETRERTQVVDLLDPAGTQARLVAEDLAVQPRFWMVPTGKRRVPDIVVALDSAAFLEVRLVLGLDHEVFFPEIAPLN